MKTSEPTPYDTGDRLEPFSWSQRAGEGYLDELEPGDFGKVDFDDDGGDTIATLWIERDEWGYVLRGHWPMGKVRIEVDQQ